MRWNRPNERENNLLKIFLEINFMEEEFKLYCPVCGKAYEKKGEYLFNKFIEVPMPVCDCEKKLEEKARIAELKRSRIRRVENLGLPDIFKPFWLANLNCEHLEDAKNYVENFKPKKSKGLFLYGKNGNGKSTLSAVICKELAYRGRTVLFTTMTEILDEMERGKNRAEQAQITLQDLLEYDFILFDDYGRENYSPLRLQNVFQIVDKLYTHKVTFAVTANPACLARLNKMPELEGIKDRMAQVLISWEFKAPSFRKNKNEDYL